MERTIYEDMYEFKSKLSKSKFNIFIDGMPTGFMLDNDISEQVIRPVKSVSNEDALLVEQFIQRFDDSICILNNIQSYPSANKFIELYGNQIGLASASYVEELREIHIKSVSMYYLENSTDAELQNVYRYISHVNYKNMCKRYNDCMRDSKSMCGLLKKKFGGLIYLPCKFGSVELYTDERLSEVILDEYLNNIGSLEILYKLANGKHRSMDVKDAKRLCAAFHKNQLMQHFVGSDRDSTKRDFLHRDMLYIDIIHLLMFPELKDLSGYIVTLDNAYEFVCDTSRDVSVLMGGVLNNPIYSESTYLEFIYLRNNINYLDYSRFKQLMEELL